MVCWKCAGPCARPWRRWGQPRRHWIRETVVPYLAERESDHKKLRARSSSASKAEWIPRAKHSRHANREPESQCRWLRCRRWCRANSGPALRLRQSRAHPANDVRAPPGAESARARRSRRRNRWHQFLGMKERARRGLRCVRFALVVCARNVRESWFCELADDREFASQTSVPLREWV